MVSAAPLAGPGSAISVVPTLSDPLVLPVLPELPILLVPGGHTKSKALACWPQVVGVCCGAPCWPGVGGSCCGSPKVTMNWWFLLCCPSSWLHLQLIHSLLCLSRCLLFCLSMLCLSGPTSLPAGSLPQPTHHLPAGSQSQQWLCRIQGHLSRLSLLLPRTRPLLLHLLLRTRSLLQRPQSQLHLLCVSPVPRTRQPTASPSHKFCLPILLVLPSSSVRAHAAPPAAHEAPVAPLPTAALVPPPHATGPTALTPPSSVIPLEASPATAPEIPAFLLRQGYQLHLYLAPTHLPPDPDH